MAEPITNGSNGSYSGASHLRLKLGLAEMLKGGVIMDVMNVEQARIAEESRRNRGDGARTRSRN